MDAIRKLSYTNACKGTWQCFIYSPRHFYTDNLCFPKKRNYLLKKLKSCGACKSVYVSTHIHQTMTPALGCFEISSVNGINPQFFTLASGWLFGQRQKSATSFTKVSQEQFLGSILKSFSSETSCVRPHNSGHPWHRCLPCSFKQVLKTFHCIYPRVPESKLLPVVPL